MFHISSSQNVYIDPTHESWVIADDNSLQAFKNLFLWRLPLKKGNSMNVSHILAQKGKEIS